MSDSSENLLSQWLGKSAAPADAGLERADRTQPLKASYAQQGMWLADVIAAETDRSSVVQHVWRIRGGLNTAALRLAFDALASRHEAWRTGFEQRDEELVQVVSASSGFDFAVEALASEAQVRDRIIKVYRTPMNLATGQVARARVFSLSQVEHVLLVTVHHIAFDGWSLDILQRELQALYSAALLMPAGASLEDLVDASGLPELPIQYPDYAMWQRIAVESGECDGALAYWSEYLAEAPALLALPYDKPVPAARSSAGDRFTLTIPAALNAAILQRANELSTTAFGLQLAAFLLTMAKWSGQQDIVLGITLAGRKEPEVEGLLGFFVNVLPIRCKMRVDDVVSDVVARLRADLLRMHDHDSVPLEYLLQHLGAARSAAHKPLVQVTVASHQNFARSPLQLDALDVRYLPPINLDVQEDLTLFFTASGDDVEAHFAFSTDLFERETILARAHEFMTTLERVCREPALTVGDLGIAMLRNDSSPRPEASESPVAAGDDIQAEIEEAMLEIWREVLPKAPLDRDANFFALGGTSLSALRACNRASSIFGVRVPVRKLFESSTIRGLSATVRELLRCAEATS